MDQPFGLETCDLSYSSSSWGSCKRCNLVACKEAYMLCFPEVSPLSLVLLCFCIQFKMHGGHGVNSRMCIYIYIYMCSKPGVLGNIFCFTLISFLLIKASLVLVSSGCSAAVNWLQIGKLTPAMTPDVCVMIVEGNVYQFTVTLQIFQ